MDFSIESYENILKAMVESEYKIITVRDYLKKNNNEIPYIILRHDVDLRPQRALRMAEVEENYGIASTYYFRTIPKIFDKEIIKKICNLGHEIGYHYEVLDLAKGVMGNAAALFKDELHEFNKICKIETICMHGNPFSRWDNRDVWKYYDFKEYGILGEAYLSVDFKNLTYISDSSRTWKQNCKIKDAYKGMNTCEVSCAEALSRVIRDESHKNIYLLIHPCHWSDSYFDAIVEGGCYFAINLTKRAYKKIIKL